MTNQKAMRTIFSSVFALISFVGFGQGLEETYDEACGCWEIVNHYDNGQVSSKHHENVQRQRDGESLTYSYEGTLLRKENWNKGKLDGTSYAYHHDGSLYYESYFEEGQKVGKWIFKEPDGSVFQEIEYSGNGADGVYTHYHAGVKYLEQTVTGGKMVEENILNQEIYEVAKEEGSATSK